VWRLRKCDTQHQRMLLRIATCGIAVGAVACVTVTLFAEQIVNSGSTNFTFDGANKPIPSWSGGALVELDGYGTTSLMFHLFARSGRKLSDIPFTIPNASA
jgi:hypothetical protein